MQISVQVLVLSVFIVAVFSDTRDCYGIECMNGGTLTMNNRGLCVCSCTMGFTGISCETEIKSSEWPPGPYSLPMSKYGCPESEAYGWETGYVSIVTMDTLDIWQVNSESKAAYLLNGDQEADQYNGVNTHLLGPFLKNGFVISFCSKSSESMLKEGMWPQGVNTVYRYEGECPVDFKNGQSLHMVIPDVLALNSDGVLPDVIIDRLENNTVDIVIKTCERVNFNQTDQNKTFNHYLIPAANGICQTVHDIEVKHEKIVMNFNGTGKEQSFFEENKLNDHDIQMEYCFFKSIRPKDERSIEDNDEMRADFDIMYKEPFTHKLDSGEEEGVRFVRSKLLYGVRILKADPDQIDWSNLVADMYGLYSYYVHPFFNIQDISAISSYPWILFQLQSLHSISSIFIALTVNVNESPVTMVNQSRLLNPGISVGQTEADFWNHGARLVDFMSSVYNRLVIPDADHDPNTEINLIYQVEHQFKNPFMGQYVMIHFPDHQLLETEQQLLLSEYFNRMVGVHIMSSDKEVMSSCGKSQELKDYQLSASSSLDDHTANISGLYDAGWCSELTDLSPYLQVDFIFPKLIAGIKVINWQKAENFQLVPYGVKSFKLTYGFKEDELNIFKSFEIDTSQSYDTTHTFMFEEGFYARLIRLHPVPLESRACMRVELMECSHGNDAQISMHCSNMTKTVNTSTTLATFDSPVSIYNVTSWLECKDTCSIVDPYCSVFEYMESNEMCLVYKFNSTSNMRTIIGNPENSTVSTNFCLDEMSETMTNDGQRKYKHIHGIGVITSLGYPISYKVGTVTTWLVTVDKGMFVHVIFTNISLNVYEGDTFCEDTITISLSQLSGFRQDYVTYDSLVKKTIDAFSNGESVIYQGESSHVYITFETCAGIPGPLHIGKGFRALIRQTDMPHCIGGWQSEHRSILSCEKPEMTFASATYLDSTPLRIPDRNSVMYFVEIAAQVSSKARYIELMITDLEILCKKDHIQFMIDDVGDARQTQYCTTDQPPYVMKTKVWAVTLKIYYLRFTESTEYKERKWLGFYGHYKFIYNNETVYNWTTSLTEAITKWNVYQYIEWDEYPIINRRACSDKFRRCYTIYPTQFAGKGWDHSQEVCMSLGQNLVSLNTEEEYLYVRLMAETHVRYENWDHYNFGHMKLNPYEVDFHIGLIRFQEGHTMLDMWVDGSPMIFSAWASGQPSNIINDRCTRMRLLDYSAEGTWYTESCDNSAIASYFICEQNMEDSSNISSIHERLGSNPTNQHVSNKPGLFRCGSGEFLSWMSVCNRFPDCEDRSDEMNCKNETACSDDEFRCSNGQCISYNSLCDNHLDCLDGEDELCNLEGEYFECKNGQKVSVGDVCNGMPNCMDGTDETNCVDCSTSSTQCHGLDRQCISSSLVCDQYTECSNGEDETSCTKFPIEECDTWWGMGYKENGYYEIYDGVLVECIFDKIVQWWGETETVIPFHSAFEISTDTYNYQTNTEQTHSLTTFMSIFIWTGYYDCYVYVNETYEPAIRKALMEDDILGDSDKTFSYTEFSSFGSLWYIEDVWIPRLMADYRDKLSPRKRIHFNDIHCLTDHYNSVYRLPCKGRYQAIRPNRFCLYNHYHDKSDWSARYLDLGCRGLDHLWECEDHNCPSDYVKCPGSFCLSWIYVCDGRNHCPGGEDEQNCYCQENTGDVYIISSGVSKTVYNFAQQFVTTTNKVLLVQITQADYFFDQILTKIADNVTIGKETVNRLDFNLRTKTDRQHQESLMKSVDVFDFILAGQHMQNSMTDWDNATDKTYDVNTTQSPFNVLVVDDIINDMSVWDIIFPLGQISLKQVKPYRIRAEDGITGLVMKEDKQEWFDVKLRSLDYLEHGGSALFENVCHAIRNGACQNRFMCEASRRCLPLHYVCDGMRQCPHGDDERICNIVCPNKCTCNGYIVNCNNRNFTSSDLRKLPKAARSLDLSMNHHLWTGTIGLEGVFAVLVKLNISSSGLGFINRNSLANFPNLQILDLSNNLLKTIPKHTFVYLESLIMIYLTGNRYLKMLEDQAFTGLTNIRSLSITNTDIEELDTKPFMGLDLDILDLSGNLKLTSIKDNTFDGLRAKHVSLKNCPITSFTAAMFTGISGVEEMSTSAFKFCCIRPVTVDESKCTPQRDEFSSCEDLMRDVSQRALLWIIGLVALIGNTLVISYRLLYDRNHLKLGYGIFVTSLAVADFFMGLYLIIVAIADQVFRNRYIWMDNYWRNSGWCKFAGVLSTVSSESSIMFMCLITIDRILVIKFPFGQIRFRTSTALTSVGACWFVVIVLSTLPLMYTDYFQDEFYSKAGVCIALPLTRERYPGWLYSIVVFVGFNFATFVLIAFGQLLIFQEVRKSSKKFKKGRSARMNDLKIARNLLLVVSTDFLCWGPVGCMGLMSIAGSTIPPTVYAWTAVLILPINSALNPFLYTLSALMSKKAFKPRLDEQTKLDPGELLLLKRMVRFWKSQILPIKTDGPTDPGKTNASNKLPPECLTQLSTEEIGKVSLQLAICLRFLHRTHLRMNNVGFLPADEALECRSDVNFIVDPSLCANEKEKADDLYKLGSLIHLMLQQRQKSIQD